MNRSLLHRLPDIVAFAHGRSRQLIASLAARDSPAAAHPRHTGARRVRLLCGDALTAMLGLLDGQGGEPPLRARIPLIWLAQTSPPPELPSAVPEAQLRARALVELTVNLFIARELMPRNGLLATPAGQDPDLCVRRVLDTVFGHTRALGAPGGADDHGRYYLAGPSGTRTGVLNPGPALLRDLVRQCTGRHDPVLVVPADPPCAAWVAELDRHWLLVQPEALGFALLREHVIARRMALEPPPGAVQESHRAWTALS